MNVEDDNSGQKTITAIVDIFVDTLREEEVVKELCLLEAVEEVYEVTGEFDIATVVRTRDIEEFRDTLKNKIMKIAGVKSVVSSIVLGAAKGQRSEEIPVVNRRE